MIPFTRIFQTVREWSGFFNTFFQNGTYTPTLFNTSNLDGSSASICSFIRVGGVVYVAGRADIDPTSIGSSTQLGIELPIASNFSDNTQCAGAGASPSIAESVAIIGDQTNNRALMQFIAQYDNFHSIYFSFAYQVI
jgi:hypothetical protein